MPGNMGAGKNKRGEADTHPAAGLAVTGGPHRGPYLSLYYNFFCLGMIFWNNAVY
jgi:hypothetical protein